MVFSGWLISGIAFAFTLFIPYPESYYSVDECKLNKTSIQNEDAPDSGNIFALALGIAAFGASMSDCCSGESIAFFNYPCFKRF